MLSVCLAEYCCLHCHSDFGHIYICISDSQTQRSLRTLLVHGRMDEHKNPQDILVHTQDKLVVIVASVPNGHVYANCTVCTHSMAHTHILILLCNTKGLSQKLATEVEVTMVRKPGLWTCPLPMWDLFSPRYHYCSFVGSGLKD